VILRSGSTPHADDPGSIQDLPAHERDHEYSWNISATAFIVRTNGRPKFSAGAVCRSARKVIAPVAGRGRPPRDTFIEEFDVFNGFLAVSVRSGGLAKLPSRLGAGRGAGRRRVLHRERRGRLCHVDIGQYRGRHELVRYAYSSLTTADTFTTKRAHREKILLKRDPVSAALTRELSNRIPVRARRDGTRIPCRWCTARPGSDGSAPLLQYAVWSVRAVTDPSFSSARLSLIDAVFIYAIAHVRGGQEMAAPGTTTAASSTR